MGAHFDARFFGRSGRESLAGEHHRFCLWKRKARNAKPSRGGTDRNQMERRGLGICQRISTASGAKHAKAVGKLPRHIAKTWWNAMAMAADLTVIEDHR